MLAIAVLIFEPVTAENGLLSSWSMSSVVSKTIIVPLRVPHEKYTAKRVICNLFSDFTWLKSSD